MGSPVSRGRRRGAGKGSRLKDGVARRIVLPAFLMALGLFAASLGVRRVLDLPLFTIREVRWEGIKRLRPEVLSEELGPLVGRNIFRISLKEIVSRMEREPGLEQVAVRREFPYRIVIALKERVPVALLSRGPQDDLIDGEGNALESLSSRSVRQTSPSPDLPRLEGKGSLGPERIREGISLAHFLASFHPDRPAPVELGERDDLAVHWDGLFVHWGIGNYPEKSRWLLQVMKDLEEKGESAREVDLRFKGQVVVRLVSR